MRPGRPLPKLQDVARHAGVSTATVSRFINGPDALAEATAERVRRAIEATGYVPNRIAGSLASQRSRLVAALVPDVAQSIFNATIEAMISELALDGHMTMLGLTGIENDRMLQWVEASLAQRVDAIILTGILTDARSRHMLRASGTTVIETWGLPPEPIDVAVGFSHLDVGREIAHFAHERGYSQPHLLSARGTRAQERRDGFVEAWRAAGGRDPTEALFDAPTRFGQGRAAFRALRKLDPMPDLVICSSDWLAQGVLVEAMAAGVRVPDELAVIGFGNFALAAEMRPTMTTVDIDGARIGREAVELLRRRSRGEPIEQHTIDVGFKLIARDSA
jgi:LacI family transcriptional regulator, gluconate utilization system Gnt-I transcriptional repressor